MAALPSALPEANGFVALVADAPVAVDPLERGSGAVDLLTCRNGMEISCVVYICRNWLMLMLGQWKLRCFKWRSFLFFFCTFKGGVVHYNSNFLDDHHQFPS